MFSNQIINVRVLSDYQSVQIAHIPQDATVVNVTGNGNGVQLWYLGRSDAEDVDRYFQVLPTGYTTIEGSLYLGTVRNEFGMYKHVFEVVNPS